MIEINKVAWWLIASLVSALALSVLIWIVCRPFIWLRRQLTTYTLGFKATIVLLIAGGIALAFALLLIQWYRIHPLLGSLIVVELIILSAVSTLAIWAWSKRTLWKLEIHMLNWQENMLARRLKSNEKEIARLEGENQTIARSKQQLEELKNGLMNVANELCRDDPQVLTLKKSKWEEEYAAMSDEELRIKSQSLESALHVEGNIPYNNKLAMELQAHLIRIEELKRAIAKPDPKMQNNEEAIKKYKLSNLSIKRRMSKIAQQRMELEMLLSSKLELN
jgi:HAMP domain-containing protein